MVRRARPRQAGDRTLTSRCDGLPGAGAGSPAKRCERRGQRHCSVSSAGIRAQALCAEIEYQVCVDCVVAQIVVQIDEERLLAGLALKDLSQKIYSPIYDRAKARSGLSIIVVSNSHSHHAPPVPAHQTQAPS
jgi:hypothetical protein